MNHASSNEAPINPGDGERAVLIRGLRAGPLAVTLKRYRHDFEQGPHEHRHGTIDLVVGGGGCGTYRRRDMRSWAGRVEYFAPGAEHSFRCGPTGICTLHVVVPADLAPRERGGRVLDLELSPSRCLSMGGAILRELRAPGPVDALTVESLALEMLAEAGRWPEKRRSGPAWLAGVIERLSEGLEGPGSISAIAADAGLHPAHMAREFRKAVGVTAGLYARRRRAARAAERVAAGREPLARIAHQCGYVDQAHMTGELRRHAGQTPGALRRLFRSFGAGAA